MVNCYQSDFATRDKIGNKYPTFVETQSCCSDRNKPYTFKTTEHCDRWHKEKKSWLSVFYVTVVDCGRPHVKLAVGFRYTHTHTGEPHSHEFVHFMSLWSNRLETYDGVKKFLFLKKKLFVHFVCYIFSVSYGFSSSSLFHSDFYLDKRCVGVCTWRCFYIYTHCLGNWVLPYCEGETFHRLTILRRAA